MNLIEITPIAIGVILGSLVITAVVRKYWRTETCSISDISFTLIGVLLVGLSVWKTVDINFSANDGLSAKFETLGQQLNTIDDGVEKIRDEVSDLQNKNIQLVKAYLNQTRYLVDERWDSIYQQADRIYRSKRRLSEDEILSNAQQMEIAGLATLLRESIFDKITESESTILESIAAGKSIESAVNEINIQSLFDSLENK